MVNIQLVLQDLPLLCRLGDRSHRGGKILSVGEMSLPSASQDGGAALSPQWFPQKERAVALEGNSWDASFSQSQ